MAPLKVIYERKPPRDVLVRYAFMRFPDASVIRLFSPSPNPARPDLATQADFPAPKDGQRSYSLTVNLDEDGLWRMLQAEQEDWQRSHPRELVEFR